LVATAVGSFSPPLVREVRKLVRTFE
jgi:hypothetical protein